LASFGSVKHSSRPAREGRHAEASPYRAETATSLASHSSCELRERGRIAVLSLAAVHDDLTDSWARAAASLRDERRLTEEDARRLRWLDAFGALIGNTDRHQYNILFFTDGSTLRLAPSFDQVSMLYAPSADGQVPPRVFSVPHVTPDTLDVWDDARDAAREFWAQGGDDVRLSDDARSFCASNAELVAKNGRGR
jgi:HipA-like C-terminal domain